MILNYIWIFFNLFKTALMIASESNLTEIVALLVEQEGIDLNVRDFYLSDSIFNLIILDFKIMFGNYINYLKQHL